MKYLTNQQQGGFIKLIIVLVVVLIVLGYFGFNVQQIIQSPSVSGNLNYVWGLIVKLWNQFLLVPATFVWDKIIIGMVWNTLMAFLGKN